MRRTIAPIILTMFALGALPVAAHAQDFRWHGRLAPGKRVEVKGVNGDVLYEGTITDGGTYVFNSHNGDMIVSVPEGANVTLSVATANGDIDPSFPLPLTATAGKHRYTFKLGSGSARMEIESFQGDIKLRRPAEIRERMERKHKTKNHGEN